MPTYIYHCPTHNEFESYHSIRDDAKLTECPTCRSELGISVPVDRLISGGSGRGIVELTGNDYKESVLKDAQRIKKEVYSNENAYANVLGQDRYQALQQRMDKNRR